MCQTKYKREERFKTLYWKGRAMAWTPFKSRESCEKVIEGQMERNMKVAYHISG